MSQRIGSGGGNEAPLRDAVDRERLVERLVELVRTPSENPPGEELKAAELTAGFCRDLGLEVELLEAQPARPSVLARWRGGDGPTLTYCSHVDVVPAGDPALWSVDPYGASISGNRMYGRGSSDAKGPIAAALEATAVLKESGWEPRGTLELALVADEETMGFQGAGWLVETGVLGPEFAIVGEPTSLRVVRAQRGACWYRLTTKGKAAHGSAPERGESAIRHMAEIVGHLENTLPDVSHDVLGGPSINVGTIRGGVKTNIVPAHCEIEIDRRTIPGEEPEDVEASVRAAIDRARETFPEIDAELELLFYSMPFEVAADSMIVTEVSAGVAEATGSTRRAGRLQRSFGRSFPRRRGGRGRRSGARRDRTRTHGRRVDRPRRARPGRGRIRARVRPHPGGVTVPEGFAWPPLLARLMSGGDLTEAEAAGAMEEILEGAATPAQIAGFVVALRAKGEVADEIIGLVRTMRELSEKVDVVSEVLDTCGTGGDRGGTFNVSTAAALVCAGAGARVAKHGNRAASSRCGSADVLEALGVRIDLPPAGVARCIEVAGIGFCFAPVFHPAMRHAAIPRRELGIATVFNFLGPLTNPAGATRQALGVADPRMLPLMVETLSRLGSTHVVGFHGHGGLDELATSGPSHVVELVDGEVREWTLDPSALGLEPSAPEALAGGTADENASAIRSVLGGEVGARRDIVVLNAAAGLLAYGTAANMEEGISLADAALVSGRATEALDGLIEESNAG